MFPHVFAFFQLITLIFVIMPFANSPIIAGGKADHALKVIMPFHLWVLVFSPTMFGLFYRIKGEGIQEKYIAALSFVATIFSAFNFVLHFIDNLVLWMWAIENLAITIYLITSIIGFYRISSAFLLPLIRRFRKSKQH